MVQYVVVNDLARTNFEKKYQLPYGYWQSHIFDTFKDAYSLIHHFYTDDKESFVIERWESGEKEIVYPEYITE